MSITTPTTATAPADPPVDPYGVDLAMGPHGDLVVNASGGLAAVGGAANCAQAVSLRLRTTPGEVALHPEYGSGVPGLVGSKTNTAGLANQANADLQVMLTEDPRFVSATVTSVTAPADAAVPKSSAIAVTAQLVGGETVTLGNAAAPEPQDVSQAQVVTSTADPTLIYDSTSEQEFFADQPEFDTLADLNTLQAMVNDTPGASILDPTTGES